MAKKNSEHEVHVQSTMAANELGMNVKTFRHYMDINKIKETELYYDKKFGGFVGYNTRNQKRYVYTVEKAGRYTSYFTDKQGLYMRSEERRVGKECRSRWS